MNLKALSKISYTMLIISGLYVISTAGWILSENRNIITIMELLTVWAAIVIVRFMIALYQGTVGEQRSQSLTALVLSACMAVVTTLNHFLYLTVIRQIYLDTKVPAWLMLDGWPSVTKGLECVAWSFFLGLSMLFASCALHSLGSKTIVWTMRISGLFTLGGLIGPIIGNMNFYLLSTAGYSIGFLVLSIELLYLSVRSKPIR